MKESGFRVEERLGVHGIDIVASKDGKRYFIEVQGNLGREGQPFDTRQKRNHIFRVIGQVCSRLNDDPEAVLCIALPEDEFYRRKVAEMQIALRRLDMTVYFVKPGGEVESTRYSEE